MRSWLWILLFYVPASCVAQPSWLLHRSYADNYAYFDSLRASLIGIGEGRTTDQLNALQNWAQEKSDPLLAGKYRLLALSLIPAHKWDASYEQNLREFALNARTQKLPLLEADALQLLAQHLDNIKKHGLAFENYLAAYKVYSHYTHQEFPAKEEYLYNIGGAYFRYEDYDNAVKYLRQALQSFPAMAPDLSATIYNTLGLSYRKLGAFDSSETYFRRIYDFAIRTNDSAWIGISLGNIGINYYHQKKYAEAIPLIQRDIQLSLATHQLKNAAGSMYILGAIYYDLNRISESEKILREALAICESRPFWPDYLMAEQLYRQLYKVYAAKNDMKMAYLYADSAIKAKDSLDNQFNALSVSRAQEKIEMVQRQLEAGQLAGQKQLQFWIRNSLLAGILLLTIIGILITNRQRLQQKKLEAEKKNAEADLITASLKLENFRQSVTEKNQIIEHFTTEIEKLKQGEVIQSETEILTQLERATILTDEQWDNFRELFETVHKGFFVSLKRKIPDLTQAEVRFLALTKLKLSSKEMASMLGISPNAIRMYRHRLRRKLNLDKEDMIEELVENI